MLGDALLQVPGHRHGGCALRGPTTASPAVEVGRPRPAEPGPLPAVGAALRTTVHRDPRGVPAADWQQLLAAGGASFFSGPDWLLPVHEHLGTGAPLLVAVRSRGRLLALAPLRVVGRVRPVVTFLGSGSSDYGTVLVAGPRTVQGAVLVDAVLDAVVAAVPGALFDLEQVRADDPLVPELLSWARRRGYGLRCVQQAVCTSLLLPPTVAHHDAGLPASVRRGERRQRRRLAERGRAQLVPDLLSGAEVPALVAELAAVDEDHPHAERRHRPWRGASGAVLAQVLAGAPREQVWLSGLRVDGRLVAYNLAFAGERVVHGYLQSYRAEHADCGPGSLLLLHLRRRSIASDRRELDMLRGEEEYKRRLSPGRVQLRVNLRVTMAPAERGALAAALDRARLLRRTFRDEARQSPVLARCAEGLAAGGAGLERAVAGAVRSGRCLRRVTAAFPALRTGRLRRS